MPVSSDLREFIEWLNSNEVEYLVVGALAVCGTDFPGTPRISVFSFDRAMLMQRVWCGLSLNSGSAASTFPPAI